MKRLMLALTLLLGTATLAQKQPLNVDDLWAMKRIGDVAVSPDGKNLAFTVQQFSFEENKGNTDIWLINADGKNLRVFKNSEKNESQPKFTPDGKKLSYIKGGQLYTANFDGSEETKLTDVYSGVSGVVWSPCGKKFLFVSAVYPELNTQEENKAKDDETEKSKVKAQIFTELMYKSWNDWRGPKRSHLFFYDLEKNVFTDLTKGAFYDVPPIDLGSSNDYTFSPDGKEIAFTANLDRKVEISTNNDIHIINVADIKINEAAPFKTISVSKGNDNQPVYSPDNKYLAFRSMERAGFEADKNRLVLFNRFSGKIEYVSDNLDISFGEMIWSADSKTIYYNAANEVYNSLFSFSVTNFKNELIKKELNSAAPILAGNNLIFKNQRSTLPYELFSMNLKDKSITQLTSLNKERLANIEMNEIETFWSEGAEGAKVQSVLVKPPFFDPNKKYPMIFLIHGGPQGHWTDDFHYRWNPQMFAAQGYVVVATNPRGSVGYGQKFCDEISGDWGGKAYTDLMNAVDYAIANYKFIDKDKLFAAGASYGGYMINWIAGHTDRFKALVSHAGVYNLESMYGVTEELWFTEWEFKGTPWNNPELYAKWSPHKYAKNFKTPMLVVHGAYDFRVPEGQGFELFTALQRQGVKSKLLYFPDEFHFVIKPQNAKLWWKTIFDWYNEFR